MKINITRLLDNIHAPLTNEDERNTTGYYHPTRRTDCTSMETTYSFELDRYRDMDEDLRATILIGDTE